jgi:Calcineurin-like phosphoesterase
MRLIAVRNRNLSLWQSAVGEFADRQSDPRRTKALHEAAGRHAAAAMKGLRLARPQPAATVENLADADPQTLAYVSQLVFEVAQAHQRGDIVGEAEALARLSDFIRPYSTLDIVGWMQCIWYYVEYYVWADREPPYRDWSQQPHPDIDFGVIEYRLPPTVKILMIGDWGTHMTDNVAMLREGLRTFSPDVIIHLGDIYYSGTKHECKHNVLKVMDELVDELHIKRPPFFTIPGNHEYYSGGVGFFDTIDRINSSLAQCRQQASYFCLRSADDAWQFLGMDTGYDDRDPVSPVAPGLHDSEIRWHHDKLKKFPGTTILLSHHQLFSANATLTDSATPYLNDNLNAAFKNYFDRVAAWFWGHEHNFVVFKDDQFGLRKGRLIGSSAYEETQAEDPYQINYDAVAYAPNMTQLSLSPYQGDIETYYNHAMALLSVSPTKIDVSYYQYPSWDRDFTPPHIDKPEFMLSETIAPSPPRIA